MTDTDITEPDQEVIDQEIVDIDQGLTDDARDAKLSAKRASQRSGEAIAELNQWRWEMTVCPYGPNYTVRGYAAAVGQSKSTIQRGAAAWQAALDSDSSHAGTDHSGCSLGGEPHHAQKPPPLTDKQVSTHDKERRILELGQEKAIMVERLAAHFGGVPITQEVNHRERVNDALVRLRAEVDLTEATVEEVTAAADKIAQQIHWEVKLRESHEREVKRWMATNRGVDTSDIKMSDVRKMVDRIERAMERKEMPWADAETETRDWDFKAREADRIQNELLRKARHAVLQLQKASVEMRLAAMKLGEAMRTIENDNIPIGDDEMGLIKLNIEDSWAIVRQAKAAVGGSSNVDWDKELRKLNKEGAA